MTQEKLVDCTLSSEAMPGKSPDGFQANLKESM
jgi:hypothetical protein